MNKKMLLIPIIPSILLLQACGNQEAVDNENIEKYGSLFIDYTKNQDKMNFDMKLNKSYNYDLKNRLLKEKITDVKEVNVLQETMNELAMIARVYEDVFFNFSILTEKEVPYILDEDKMIYLESINEETKNAWYTSIRTALENINETNLQKRDIELIDNAKILVDSMNTVLTKSLNGEHDEKTLKEIQLNIEKNYADIVTLYLMSEGHPKEDIEIIFKDIKNNNEFKSSFYYQFMITKSK